MNSLSYMANRLYEGTLAVPPSQFREWLLSELAQWLDCSGAIWRRNREQASTHGLSVIGLPRNAPTVLIRNRESNPLYEAWKRAPGRAESLDRLMDENEFYGSVLFNRVLKPLGIGRMAGLIWREDQSGLVTEITLYRGIDGPAFQPAELLRLQELAPFLIGSAAHSIFLEAVQPQAHHWNRPVALVDAGGRIYEVQGRFMDVLNAAYPAWNGTSLPFPLPQQASRYPFIIEGLNVYVEAVGDLSRVRVWPRQKLDALTPRELEIAEAIATGRSYKIVAKELGLSASTVSNHLQRIYAKLGLESRTALSELFTQ